MTALPAGVPTQLGPYRVERELARGGMGIVLAARHEALERAVAIKVILGDDPTRLERFRREGLAMAQLRHPNVVAIHELLQERGQLYLVMDLIEGTSLERRLADDGPLPPRDAALMAERLARALAYAHSKKVLHRDMKPGNVLIAKDGQPLLADFGLARLDELGSGTLTVQGAALGTPLYMPPEQAAGDRKRVDERSDVYALGATLYEMLTGQPPFRSETLAELLGAILEAKPRPPSELRPEVDRALGAIVLRCLEKDPARRFASADQLADALAAWREPSQRRRRGLHLPLAALVGVVVGAGAGALARPKGSAGVAPVATASTDAKLVDPLEEARRLEARGFAASAEEVRWRALRDSSDGAPLRELVRAGLTADDASGLARQWEEVARRLALAGAPGGATGAGERERGLVVHTLADAGAPWQERLAAALSAVTLHDVGARQALRDAAADAPPPVRAAALASLLAQGDDEGAFERWARLVRDDTALDGAGHALTLLEHAPRLDARTAPLLAQLAQARGALLRGALPLAVALAATRPGGLTAEQAEVQLGALAQDATPDVAARAVRVRAALRLLAAPEAAAPSEVVLLAWRLANEPGANAGLRAPALKALEQAAQREPANGALGLALAWDALAEGRLDDAGQRARAVIAAGGARRVAHRLGALEVVAQAELVRGAESALARADDDDPEAHARALRRLEFARSFMLAALPEPHGAVRVTASFTGGLPPRSEHAFEVHAADGKVVAEGFEARSFRLLTRFGLSSCWAVDLTASSQESTTLSVGASGEMNGSGGIEWEIAARHSSLSLDEQAVGKTRHAGYRGRALAVQRRGSAGIDVDGAGVATWLGLPARRRAGAHLFLRQSWGKQTALTRLVVVGRWDGEQAAPALLTPVQLETWAARLEPLPGETPLVREHAGNAADEPRTLEALRRSGQPLRASGPWTGRRRTPSVVGVGRVSGDVEVRARVTFDAKGRQAGVALRASDGCGDNVRLYFATGSPALWFQRGDGWDYPVHIVQGSRPDGPLWLALRRKGDLVIALMGEDEANLAPLPGPPLRFAFRGPVDALVYASNYDAKEPFPVARFDGIDVRAPRTTASPESALLALARGERERATELADQAAARGDPRGWFLAGELHRAGLGAPADVRAAADRYRKGADAGDARCMTQLAFLLGSDALGAPDHAAALPLLEAAAAKGEVLARHTLGEAHERGLGVVPDLEAAARHYAAAAALGSAESSHALGRLAEAGKLPGGRETAAGHYEQAARLGHADAQRALVRLRAAD